MLWSDVTLYLAPFDNVFVVKVDNVTGVHQVSVDPAYRYRHSSAFHQRHRRHADNDTSNSNSTEPDDDKVKQVTFPPLSQPKLVLDLATPEGCDLGDGV